MDWCLRTYPKNFFLYTDNCPLSLQRPAWSNQHKTETCVEAIREKRKTFKTEEKDRTRETWKSWTQQRLNVSASRRLRTSCGNTVIPSRESWRSCRLINLWTCGAITIKTVSKSDCYCNVCWFKSHDNGTLRRAKPPENRIQQTFLAPDAQWSRHKPFCRALNIIKTNITPLSSRSIVDFQSHFIVLFVSFFSPSHLENIFSISPAPQNRSTLLSCDNIFGILFSQLTNKRKMTLFGLAQEDERKNVVHDIIERSIFCSMACEINNPVGQMKMEKKTLRGQLPLLGVFFSTKAH